eukprot:TRINITY_DN10903_c0_g1_i2.p1 TRINITY_DN10903_c0_g1~~TRINITY_DN10903_c0_g1_i2.p1  ORF type:complete len:562 (+),score=79.89 TRINITY_DN10903_c0_g1_i2:78-1688(+)
MAGGQRSRPLREQVGNPFSWAAVAALLSCATALASVAVNAGNSLDADGVESVAFIEEAAYFPENSSNESFSAAVLGDDLGDEQALSFHYHKPAFPLMWIPDGITLIAATFGLVIAASGGIGGGGILVPIFMLLLRFRPKHAIALSNFTIFGGAIANTMLNARRRHPQRQSLPLIDWDIIVMMEPLTIFGAVFGSLLSKVLPNLLLTLSLVGVLVLMGRHTLTKGLSMWKDESRQRLVGNSHSSRSSSAVGVELVEAVAGSRPPSIEPDPTQRDDCEREYVQLEETSPVDNAVPSNAPSGFSQIGLSVRRKIVLLTVCFAGTCILTVLKGGGSFPSPFGVTCGSFGFWILYFAGIPWIVAFVIYFRNVLMSEYQEKVRIGHVFLPGEVRWDSGNAVRYPALCAVSGLLAGLFGVGGGIVKGPLMLEMGVVPVVASASAAAMILYTSAAASTSFVVFGLLEPVYGAIFFTLGFSCTIVGQYTVSKWVKKHNRQSPIVLSIGAVICLSAVLVAVESGIAASNQTLSELFSAQGVCSDHV